MQEKGDRSIRASQNMASPIQGARDFANQELWSINCEPLMVSFALMAYENASKKSSLKLYATFSLILWKTRRSLLQKYDEGKKREQESFKLGRAPRQQLRFESKFLFTGE
ncbi:uncharacterized protein ZBAI_03026 [Zygosaccharomyces bailii ISA1307]|nr:uncharacterized protein ZBAI_03026 [Zygosaccharomyces bailii ISA1307]